MTAMKAKTKLMIKYAAYAVAALVGCAAWLALLILFLLWADAEGLPV